MAGDFNEDGRLDLAVAIKILSPTLSPGNRGRCSGHGDGTFTDGSSFTTGT